MTYLRLISTTALLTGALACCAALGCSAATGRASADAGGSTSASSTGGSGGSGASEPGGAGTGTASTEPEPLPTTATCVASFPADQKGTFTYDADGKLRAASGQGGDPFGAVGLLPGGDQPCTGFIAPDPGGTMSNVALCATGTIPAHATSLNSAFIGTQVNAWGIADGVVFPATASSLDVTYSGTSDTVVRLQVNTTDHKYYCATLAPGAHLTKTLVPADFNTACWSLNGETWDGTKLEAIQLSVPSRPGLDTDFNLCLESFQVN